MDELLCFFFFKQNTAYEWLRSLVGSEMCIRDSRSLNTTERYLRLAITDLKEARRKFHPRERGGTLI